MSYKMTEAQKLQRDGKSKTRPRWRGVIKNKVTQGPAGPVRRLDPETLEVIEVLSLTGKVKELSEIQKFYLSWDWKRARYEALLIHGRRCLCCGATPDKGAVLHVDHVQPVRHRWDLRLDQANLQVLCEECNMGKGSHDETDFRR